MKTLAFLFLFVSLSTFAEEPVSVSADCIARGAKAALVAALAAAAPEGLISVGLNLEQDKAVYVEGDDILVPLKIISTRETKPSWYYVRVQKASACSLAKPAPYSL